MIEISKTKAADVLNVSRATIHNWINDGTLQTGESGDVSLDSLHGMMKRDLQIDLAKHARRGVTLEVVSGPEWAKGADYE